MEFDFRLRSFHVHSINRADPREAILQRLAEIREDPRMRSLAIRYAGHPDLADDALQSAYYAVARLKNLEQIQNLRAYFRKVLIRECVPRAPSTRCRSSRGLRSRGGGRQDARGGEPASPPCVESCRLPLGTGRIWLGRWPTIVTSCSPRSPPARMIPPSIAR